MEAYPYPPEEAENATHPPIEITLRLSDDVMYFSTPVIARWDPAGMNLGHKFILSLNNGIYTPEFYYFQNPAVKMRANLEPRNNLGPSIVINLVQLFLVLFCFCIISSNGLLVEAFYCSFLIWIEKKNMHHLMGSSTPVYHKSSFARVKSCKVYFKPTLTCISINNTMKIKC